MADPQIAGLWDDIDFDLARLLPEHAPLFMQTALMGPARQGNFAPLMDPFQRAAYRTREAVQPGRPMPGPPPAVRIGGMWDVE